jgi:hypothetical protein
MSHHQSCWTWSFGKGSTRIARSLNCKVMILPFHTLWLGNQPLNPHARGWIKCCLLEEEGYLIDYLEFFFFLELSQHLFNLFFLLFICAYNVWVISPPFPLLPSLPLRMGKKCPFSCFFKKYVWQCCLQDHYLKMPAQWCLLPRNELSFTHIWVIHLQSNFEWKLFWWY